jgi:hypothetical protein
MEYWDEIFATMQPLNANRLVVSLHNFPPCQANEKSTSPYLHENCDHETIC